MRKVTKKRASRAASSASSSDDDKSEKDKKVSNGAGKKDGANNLDNEIKSQKNGDDKKSKSNSQAKKRTSEQNDDKNKRKRQRKDESDESNGSDSSEDEALSKIAKISKKPDTSSNKGKGNKKEKEQPKPIEQDDQDDDQQDDDVEYEVEEVVSHKKSHGKMLYLIRWKGFEEEDDTWENAATLDNCPDILKKYTDEHPDSILPSTSSKPPKSSKTDKKEKKHKKLKETVVDEEFDENADYEVEKIIDVFFKKDKSREFLVRWKGYRSEYDSWEPEEHLSCPDLIDKYMSKVEQAKNLSEKELRPVRRHTERFTLRTQTSERRMSRRHDGKQRAVYYDADD